MLIAYKYVALAALILEANFNAERLNVPVRQPISEGDITFELIAPTNILAFGGFMGSIHAGQYAFSEGGGRNYRLVCRIAPFGDSTSVDAYERLSHGKSLITTNIAYQLATNWLTRIDVDMKALEKGNKCTVRQRWFYGDKGNVVLVPIFDIKWGDWDEPKVDVGIDGTTKQFIEIRQEDDSFSGRPQSLIRDWTNLVAISDEEFLKYTSLEKSNLLARFVVNWPAARGSGSVLETQIVGADGILCANANYPLNPGVLIRGKRAQKLLQAMSSANRLREGDISNCSYGEICKPLNVMYLAYKYVVLTIVIAHANFCAERLQLPVALPIKENDLTSKFIVMPDVIPIVDLGAAIEKGDFSFSYGDRSCFIARLRPFGDLSAAEQNEMLSHAKSLITTNDAYGLATNWLSVTDVDIARLERTNRWTVTQRYCFGEHGSTILLPVYYVRWGNGGDPKVEVSIDGRTKSLIELLEYDRQTYVRHSAQLVKDYDKLLAISDAEFQKYSQTERSNLVVRFAMTRPENGISTNSVPMAGSAAAIPR